MAITAGANLNSVPSHVQKTLSTNYLDLNSSTGWAQQYVPDLMEKEAEVFGQRTISGFLSQIGAEEAMTADQVIWSEQGRLHLSYKGKIATNDGSGGSGPAGADIDGTGAGGATTKVTIQKDMDGNDKTTDHGIRVNDTVIIANSAGVHKCLVVTAAAATATIDVAPYGGAAIADSNGDSSCTILVYGSEYGKGTSYMVGGTSTAQQDSRGANEPSFKTFQNKPIILKDYYSVSGSDASRVGWVEITAESGASGYLWYLKAEADTRARFNDYLEMAMLEGELNAAGSLADGSNLIPGSTAGADHVGTEGLFAAIEDRGNLTSGVTGVNAATDLAEFDAILAEFDKQGAIEENMMFLDRGTALSIDNMLAQQNAAFGGGASYGVFNNAEDMALNLGFSGFRRGSYDFYKTDWKYLNDSVTRGGFSDIEGVIVPAGTSTVYDESLGKNISRPFLHVRYRASEADDRKMKSWITGSVGGNYTSTLDKMQVNFLSERCLCVQAANNFVLLKRVS